MNKLINKSNLDINSLLIKWSLMKGYLHNGIVQSTKFGLFNQWFTFCICLYTAIKWSILLFYPKGSKMDNLLGDFGYFYGPKIIIDVMLAFGAIYVIIVKIQLIFLSKHPKKMFYWLDTMVYNDDNHSFDKLNLNQTESKMFIKRLSLSVFLLKCFTKTFTIFFIITSVAIVLGYQNDYLLNYLISILLFVPQLYFNIQFIYGFFVILYPVS